MERVGSAVRNLLRIDVGEQARLLLHLVRWTVIGCVVGVVAGASSAAFLASLDWATRTRLHHPALLWGLPVFGLATGAVYQHLAGRAAAGSSLLIDEVHEPTTWVPRRLAPLVFACSVGGHLFGASVGREGAAIQIAGGLTDAGARLFRVSAMHRRLLLVAAIAGGFGAVFGAPLAGAVFGLEVLTLGRIRYDALVPAFAASLVGGRIVTALGEHHAVIAQVDVGRLPPLLLAKVAVAGVAFGLTALLFVELTHGIMHVLAEHAGWPPLRTFLGGCVVIGLTYAVGDRDYLGLSLPLLSRSLAGGAGVIGLAFALKLLFTSISLGSGFQGGEVTPLFVIGAALGVTLARVLDAPVSLFAAVGMVAVFAGAANTPLACTILAVEIFGAALAVPAAIACIVSYVVSAERGIYSSQRIDAAHLPTTELDADATVGSFSLRRRPWLPPRR